MSDPNSLELERAYFPQFASGNFANIGDIFQTMFSDSIAEQTECQTGGVDRYREALENIGNRPHVVFMRMRQNNRFELVLVFQKIADIGDDQVDAEQIGAGKHQA